MRSERNCVVKKKCLILDFARKNNLIKVVLLNGSRAKPNAQKDKFMDYDVVYVVDNTQSFIENKDWIKDFGKILIMQEPDNPNLFVSEVAIEEKYTYLIHFKDGNCIDLTFATIEFAKKICLKELYNATLLDKHGIFSKLYAPNVLYSNVFKFLHDFFRQPKTFIFFDLKIVVNLS